MSTGFFQFPAQKSRKAQSRVRLRWLFNLRLVWWAPMFGLALWFCGSQNGGSRGAPPHQVLPVLSLSCGFSVAGPCCSHSSPFGSHWSREGSFSSWLDGRAASPPSESCTQRCLCQPRSREEATVQTVCFQSQNHKTLKHSLRFFFFFFFHYAVSF